MREKGLKLEVVQSNRTITDRIEPLFSSAHLRQRSHKIAPAILWNGLWLSRNHIRVISNHLTHNMLDFRKTWECHRIDIETLVSLYMTSELWNLKFRRSEEYQNANQSASAKSESSQKRLEMPCSVRPPTRRGNCRSGSRTLGASGRPWWWRRAGADASVRLTRRRWLLIIGEFGLDKHW